MSYVPRGYEEIVRDLLTTLTGGTVRETIAAPENGETVALARLRNRPVRRISHLQGKVLAGTREVDYRFSAADFELVATSGDGEPDAIRFRDGGTRPVPGSQLVVNYYPVETGPVPLTDLNVGSVVRTLMETFARELAVTYLHLEHIYDSAFLDTAEGPSLDKVAALVGVTRLPAGYPVVKVRFSRGSGAPGRITVPAGTPIVDAAGNRYLTMAALTLEPNETTRDVMARGDTPGTPLVKEDELDRPELKIAGISEVTNPEPARALAAPETDDELRRRAPGALHGVVRGTLDALRFGLLSIDGVKDVVVTEEPNGVPGEIRIEVAYVDENDEEVQRAVARTIEAVKPAGIRIESRGAVRRRIDIRVKLTLAGAGAVGPELEATERGVRERVTALLAAVPPGGKVRRAQLSALVLQDPAIVDASVELLQEGQDPAEELELDPGEVLEVGAVQFTAPDTEQPAEPPPTTAMVSAILPVHLAPGITQANATNAITLALDSYLRSRRSDAPLTVDGLAAAIRDDTRFALVRSGVQLTVEHNGSFRQLVDNVGDYAPPANQTLEKGRIDVAVQEGAV